jgi:hypothetical protein
MTEDKVKRGDISTYRNASDRFLEQRREDARAQIFNPNLSANEFGYGVLGPAAVAVIGAGWSVWQGIGRGLDWLIKNPKTPWFQENLMLKGTHGRIGYMTNVTGYEEALRANSENIAGVLAGKISVEKACTDILMHTELLKHRTGRGDIEALLAEVKAAGHLSPEQTQAFALKFFGILEKIHTNDPQAHIGQYHRLTQDILLALSPTKTPLELETVLKGDKPQALIEGFTKEGRDAFHRTKQTIIGSALTDNRNIINRVRIPGTIAVASLLGLATAYRAYRTTKKQKTLDLESETSFIDRQLNEREDKRAAGTYPSAEQPIERKKFVKRLEIEREEPTTSQAAAL